MSLRTRDSRRHRARTVLAGCLVAAMQSGIAADVVSTVGVPQASSQASIASAWRYVGARFDAGDVRVDAKFPVPVTEPRIAASNVGLGQVSARWLVTRDVRDVDVSVTARAWRSGDRSDALADGNSLELEAGRAWGRLYAYSGYSLPATRTGHERWRGAFAGLEWDGGSYGLLALTADDSREERGGLRDRRVTVRYAFEVASQGKLQLFVTRRVDDPVDRWTAGLGAQWSF